MRRNEFIMLAVLFVLASAHARLDPKGAVKPRSTDSGLKTGPCGGIAATDDPAKRTILTAGETITIMWEETINHPGWFRIAFSPEGDSGFEDNVLKDNIVDTQNGSVTYNDPSTYHKYSTTITVPSQSCDNCSLQLIQYMTENPSDPKLYYSCADIRIVASSNSDDKPAAPKGVKIEWRDSP